MDKKNTVIGVLLLAAAVASFVISARYAPAPAKPVVTTTSSGSPIAQNEAPASGPAHSVADAAFTAPEKSSAPAEYLTLENEFVAVRFTTAGGAIDRVALKKHPAIQGNADPYVLNASQAAPALSLLNFPGIDNEARYTLVSQTATEAVYRTVLDGKLEVTRRYSLLGGSSGDPYQIRHETTFRNLTAQPLPLSKLSVSVGTAVPLNENDSGIYLNVGYNNGDKPAFVRRDALAGGGFFTQSPPMPFMEKTVTRQEKNAQGDEVPVPALSWVTVKNQFFAAILTPDQPGSGVRIERVKLDPLAPAEKRSAYGVTAAAEFNLPALGANASATWGATYFAGPKEYSRLSKTANFKHGEDLVMEFGFFGFFSKLLLTIMTWIHGMVVHVSPVWAWGWSIVLTTLTLKLVFVPFTLAASRSSKRMQKIMPLIKASKEKYKDSPAKAQEAMMKIYKEHKVNPIGGCVPILITIPFFIGFFSMLQSTAELRFASFLWAHDLAAPDTILTLGPPVMLPILGLIHLNINILPILMGATNFFQMRLTPTPTADPAQAAMMKFMPIMFVFFFYSYASALALYSTVNGLFTIAQQMVINKMPEHQLPAVPAAVAGGGIKNVTPKKK